VTEAATPAVPPPDPEVLARRLHDLGVGRGQRLLAAYSGGLDSTVLLHLLHRLRGPLGLRLEAVHVDHGLHPEAPRWRAHCQAVCARWGIPCRVERPAVRRRPRQSLEAVAREVRYRCLAALLGEGDVLLTAHHLDDQAETVLLMLLRGSGPAGLAAMPAQAPLGAGRLLRPLLDWPREALRRYALAQGLDWLEDPSNADPALERNRLRHRIMPPLREAWPGAARALSRSAAHCAEAAALLAERAGEDLAACRGAYTGLLPPPWPVLSVAALGGLDGPRRRNLLRHWLGEARGRPPPGRLLEVLERDLLGAGPSGRGAQRWGPLTLRRYRDQLALFPPAPAAPWRPRRWDLAAPLVLDEAGLELTVGRGPGGLDPARLPPGGLWLRPRRGGEACRPAGRAGHHALKKLFQERGIPPWERGRLPLLWIDETLAGVAGLCVCQPFACAPPAEGLHVRVAPRPPVSSGSSDQSRPWD